MEDVGREPQFRKQVHHGAREKGEAFAVVEVAVDFAPAEVILVVDEIIRHAVVLQFKQAAVKVAPG
jgi:hypothetical protein